MNNSYFHLIYSNTNLVEVIVMEEWYVVFQFSLLAIFDLILPLLLKLCYTLQDSETNNYFGILEIIPEIRKHLCSREEVRGFLSVGIRLFIYRLVIQ